MESLHLSLRAPQLIPLILLIQAQLSTAHPFVHRGYDDGSGPGRRPDQRPHYAIPPSLNGVQTTSWPSPAASSAVTGFWTTYTISQITDGQIQAPYHRPIDFGADWNDVTTMTAWMTGDSNAPPIEPTALPTRYSAPTEESPAAPTVVPGVALTSLTTSEMQTATVPVMTNTTGFVQSSLDTSGNPTIAPFPTSVVEATSTIALANTSSLADVVPTYTANLTSIGVGNIFQAMATDAPPAQISSRSDHPVARQGIQPQQKKIETNKFYANLFLENQDQPVYTFPYSIRWSRGFEPTNSYGLAISHTEPEQLAQGAPNGPDGAVSFIASPVGIQSLIMSASNLGEGTRLTTDTIEPFSVNVNLIANGAYAPTITFPLVQGMGYVTGYYRAATPILSSSIGINSITYVGAIGDGTIFKYRVELASTINWLVYVTPDQPDYAANGFKLRDSSTIEGTSGFQGRIQIAKVPLNTPDAETVYDRSAGAYANTANVTGSVNGTTGTYGLSWSKAGKQTQDLLMYALPHHMQSLTNDTRDHATDVKLFTSTKGMGTAILADSWTLVETDLPVDMDFAPWRPGQGSLTLISDEAKGLMNAAGLSELSQNITMQTDLDSMYYSGKGLAKFASINYALHDISGNTALALAGLQRLEGAFARFVNNQQIYPLVYDDAWGGLVSSGTYLTGNTGVDFGNALYNDHHFHYGYFVYAAAVIAYLDPNWLTQGSNKAWVDSLVRDFANPSHDDPYFPFSRSFDWYHGHSWAKGLFPSTDGKDQESSSEDTLASYGLKMWGHITGDLALEARGNLMLSVQARSLQDYYLMDSNNDIQPRNFIGNKAAGIMFENKIDHTTYFGGNIEYVEGIHMIPLMPFSTLSRTTQFVQEEWDTYFTDYASTVQGGWRGVLMANLAIIDPYTSYEFFANRSGQLDLSMLDGGASQTWYLAWAAGLQQA